MPLNKENKKFIYIYIHTHTHTEREREREREREMIDLGKSDKMRKIIGKLDQQNTDNEFINGISFLF